MSKYISHINAICKNCEKLYIWQDDQSVLDDIALLRKSYRAVRKELADTVLYPNPPQERALNRTKTIDRHKKIIVDVCTDLGINWSSYHQQSFEVKKLDMPYRFKFNGVILNWLLDFQ